MQGPRWGRRRRDLRRLWRMRCSLEGMAIIWSGLALLVSPAWGAFHQKPNSGVSREGDRGASCEKPSEMGESFRAGEGQKGIKGGVWVSRAVKPLFHKGIFLSSVTGKAEFVQVHQGCLLG